MADNTKFVSLGKKTLSRFLSTSSTTLYANNLNFDKEGTRALALSDLGDYGWITIEPRSKANRELCKVTGVSGNTLTIARGFKPFAPYDQDTATWAKTHEAGVSFVFSNPPQMYDEFAVKDNEETITARWTFDEDTRPKLDVDADSSVDEEFVTFGQLYRTSIAGATNASETHNGLVEKSTNAEVDSGASVGGTGAFLFATPAQIAAQLQSGAWLSGSTAGTASAITATLTPTLTAYSHNMIIALHTSNANNAGCTLNIDGLGAKAVYKYAGGSAVAVEAGDMGANYHHIFLYDSDSNIFLLVNPVNGDLTAAIRTQVDAYFATTKTQSNKVTMTAGHALSSGELVAIESDGKVYRTRPTGIPGTNANTATSAGEQFGSAGRKEMYLTPTSTRVVWLGDDQQSSTHHGAFVVVSDALYGSPSSAAWTAIASTDAVFTDSLLVGDMVISAYRLSGGATTLRATADIDGTPSNGGEMTVAASGGDAVGVATTTAANTYVAISNNGSNLVGYKVTASGSTLTNAASGTLLSGSGLQCVVAKQFTGTDFILAVYTESSSVKAVVGEYNTTTGAWTSVGTPITIEGSGGDPSRGAYLSVISSTKMFLGWQGSSDVKGAIITRTSGTTISATSPASVITSVTVPGMVSFSMINSRNYLFGAETSSGGKLQIVSLDRDYTAVSSTGSARTYGSTTDRGVSGCILTPTRIITVYQSDATNSVYAIEDLGTNLDGIVGFAGSTVSTDATTDVTVSGHTSGLSGLSAGSLYFPELNGGLTTSELGTVPINTSSLTRPKVVPVLKALSSTSGIKI